MQLQIRRYSPLRARYLNSRYLANLPSYLPYSGCATCVWPYLPSYLRPVWLYLPSDLESEKVAYFTGGEPARSHSPLPPLTHAVVITRRLNKHLKHYEQDLKSARAFRALVACPIFRCSRPEQLGIGNRKPYG